MADNNTSDIFIKFVLNKRPIEGESTTALKVANGRNDLLLGFEAGKMFELTNFTFSVGIEDNDEEGGGGRGNAAQGRGGPSVRGGHGAQGGRGGTGTHGGRGGSDRKAPKGGFTAWRTGRKHKPYPLEVQPITFTRAIDTASTALLRHCIRCTSFDYVALVKRKPAGGAAAGEGYLRMDFVGSLITDISWTNEDPIKETCKFISRSITVRYKPQLPDGSLGAPRIGFWSMLPWETEAPLR